MEKKINNTTSTDLKEVTLTLHQFIGAEWDETVTIKRSVLDALTVSDYSQQVSRGPNEDELDLIVAAWTRPKRFQDLPYRQQMWLKLKSGRILEFWGYVQALLLQPVRYVLSGPMSAFDALFGQGIRAFEYEITQRYTQFKFETGRGRAETFGGVILHRLVYILHHLQVYKFQGIREYLLRTLDSVRLIEVSIPVVMYAIWSGQQYQLNRTLHLGALHATSTQAVQLTPSEQELSIYREYGILPSLQTGEKGYAPEEAEMFPEEMWTHAPSGDYHERLITQERTLAEFLCLEKREEAEAEAQAEAQAEAEAEGQAMPLDTEIEDLTVATMNWAPYMRIHNGPAQAEATVRAAEQPLARFLDAPYVGVKGDTWFRGHSFLTNTWEQQANLPPYASLPVASFLNEYDYTYWADRIMYERRTNWSYDIISQFLGELAYTEIVDKKPHGADAVIYEGGTKVFYPLETGKDDSPTRSSPPPYNPTEYLPTKVSFSDTYLDSYAQVLNVVSNHVILLVLTAGYWEWVLRLQNKYRRSIDELPQVYERLAHIGRLKGYVGFNGLIGNREQYPTMIKLFNAFQAKRGEQLYFPTMFLSLWEILLNSLLPPSVDERFLQFRRTCQAKWDALQPPQPSTGIRLVVEGRTDVVAGPPSDEMVKSRISLVPEIIQHGSQALTYFSTHAAPRTSRYAQIGLNFTGEQRAFNWLKTGVEFVEREIRHSLPLAVIRPGVDKLTHLPHGLLLAGESGNGRELFVRAFAGESRLPLFVTESNRFVDQQKGALRLASLFRRARSEAPNIVFIRDLDLITRDRQKDPRWQSVRLTTQFLLHMDGYTDGSEQRASKRQVFVIGAVTTTAGMDSACKRSGRFEWVINFSTPIRLQRFELFGKSVMQSPLPARTPLDLNYLTALTKGYNAVEIQSVLNTSALWSLYTGRETHTMANLLTAIGKINAVRDKSVTLMGSSRELGLFECFAGVERSNPVGDRSFTHLNIDGIPFQQKVIHILHAMAKHPGFQATQTTPMPVNLIPDPTASGTPTIELIDGLVELMSEYLFVQNLADVTGYPYTVYDTYCVHLGSRLRALYNKQAERHSLDQITSARPFMRTFHLWQVVKQQHAWTAGSTTTLLQLTQRFHHLHNWQTDRMASAPPQKFKFHYLSSVNPNPRPLHDEMCWATYLTTKSEVPKYTVGAYVDEMFNLPDRLTQLSTGGGRRAVYLKHVSAQLVQSMQNM